MKRRIIIIFLGTILGSLCAGKEAQEIISQAEQASKFGSIDAKTLIHSLKDPTRKISKILGGKAGKACTGAHSDHPSGKCGMNLKSQDVDKPLAQLYIFVSSSMPQESIKVLGQQAQKIGAHIVFRGLVGGTFSKTQIYMQDLGIAAEIDPPKFDDHNITVVPTFVLVNKQTIDRVEGHISLIEALDQFRKKAELKTEAQKLYQNLQGMWNKS
ncbi:MAG: type-F conjugative transfer system pilin assembly protein TrbC [Alphaproteobacteria bacterium]|nr:type-F conjugative transfer system pilin assembly protein TrbC [Alphaproteobacteria bacterium]